MSAEQTDALLIAMAQDIVFIRHFIILLAFIIVGGFTAMISAK